MFTSPPLYSGGVMFIFSKKKFNLKIKTVNRGTKILATEGTILIIS